MKFPSLDWFQALQGLMRQDRETFRRLGFCDTTVAVKIEPNGGLSQPRTFILSFDGYDCKAVQEVDRPETAAFDFALEGPYHAWKEMVENIRENGEADLDHTLNRLALAGAPLRLVAADQLCADLFYRYNQTLQQFFNRAARLETEFIA